MSNLKNLFKAPKIPVKKVVPMADPSSSLVKEAGRLAQENALKRSGRRSTILSRSARRNYDSFSSTNTGAGS